MLGEAGGGVEAFRDGSQTCYSVLQQGSEKETKYSKTVKKQTAKKIS